MRIQGDQQIKGVATVDRRVIEGLRAVQINGDYQLTHRSAKFFRFVADAPATVTLPDATKIASGYGFELVFYTTSSGISLRDYSGTILQTFEPGIVYYCYIMGNSTPAGEWIINMDVSYDIAVGDTTNPSRGVRAYFKIDYEYTGSLV